MTDTWEPCRFEGECDWRDEEGYCQKLFGCIREESKEDRWDRLYHQAVDEGRVR